MSREVIKENRGYSDTEQDLLRPPQVAQVIGISVDTLKDWRINGRGPTFVRAGYRTVRYRRCDVDRWVQQQTIELDGDNDRSNGTR